MRAVYLIVIVANLFGLWSMQSMASNDLVSLFPIEHYDQSVSSWMNPRDPDYDKVLLPSPVQQIHLQHFYQTYLGERSPWNERYVSYIIAQGIAKSEQKVVKQFDNEGKEPSALNYGENFRPHPSQWIEQIRNNIPFDQIDRPYEANQRAITIDNVSVRSLPTGEVAFFNPQQAGQGYPFDNLQVSALWIGTPVYILAKTVDLAWSLILTADFIGWVDSSVLAVVDDHFINTWTATAKSKLAAIIQTKTILKTEERFLAYAYIGSVFPVINNKTTSNKMTLMVPIKNQAHQAVIQPVEVIADKEAVIVPWLVTPHHVAILMQTLIQRPYGWGGFYFYNDCSAELKSLLTPFGMWIPRHSSAQTRAGQVVDQSDKPPAERLQYLIEHGHKLLTILYIGNHVVLYIGNEGQANHQTIAMSYQNIWGLKPRASLPDKRVVIGGSVFLPLLLQYPEDPTLVSLVDKKYFKLIYLDQLPVNFLAQPLPDLQSLMLANLISIGE